MRVKVIINFLMNQPVLYKFVQETLAAGGHKTIKDFLVKQVTTETQLILDQGCGTGEYALLFGDRYTGIDNNPKDIEFAQRRYPGRFILGSATNMSQLADSSFDMVFAVGLHHHLSDDLASEAIIESLRVTKKNGKVVIIDAMLPKNPSNLVGLLLRKMDRGGHVRRIDDTFKLMPKSVKYDKAVLSSFPFDYVTIVAEKP